MPEIINCPQCERKLRVPEEMLGAFVVMRLVAMLFLAGGGVGRGAAPAFGLVMLSVTCIAGIGLIAAAIWYLVVLFQVRGALSYYLERS